MVFFFVFFFQMVITIIQTIGIPGMGTCGFIMALSQFDSSVGGIFVGLFLLLIAIGFGTCAAGDVMMLTKRQPRRRYRPAYKAFRNDSSFNFMVFFFVFFFQMVITIIQTIGIPGMGTCGFIMALSQFDSSVGGIFVGLFLLLIAIGFGTCAAGDVMMLTKIHSIYRSSGASFAKAQAEFTTEFMRNPHVQQAATNAATAAVSSQINNRY
uniref:Secretory carrier-associated membrane protein n=2 Tax=Lutzomyia longipalpis TaxID=7200 RepID=A0A1B0C8D0_LUTLO